MIQSRNDNVLTKKYIIINLLDLVQSDVCMRLPQKLGDI